VIRAVRKYKLEKLLEMEKGKRNHALENPDKVGCLLRQNDGVVKNWKKNWVVLKEGIVYLYNSQKVEPFTQITCCLLNSGFSRT